jgi:hypothetical protein
MAKPGRPIRRVWKAAVVEEEATVPLACLKESKGVWD